MDFFSPIECRQVYGVPLGGVGTGSIGRSYTGEFLRYQIIPGIYEHESVDANLFTVCIRKKSNTVYQQALTVGRCKQRGFRSWNMAFCGDQASYYALYPESWTVYELPGQHVTLTCHQINPILPNNYKDTSLPVALFEWTVENKNKEDIEFSLMFTWQAGSASDKFQLTDVSSKPFVNQVNYNTSASGVIINQKLKNIPFEYCIAAKNTVCYDSYKEGLFFNQN
jgi:non-lysosomal glucosylceramidase